MNIEVKLQTARLVNEIRNSVGSLERLRIIEDTKTGDKLIPATSIVDLIHNVYAGLHSLELTGKDLKSVRTFVCDELRSIELQFTHLPQIASGERNIEDLALEYDKGSVILQDIVDNLNMVADVLTDNLVKEA